MRSTALKNGKDITFYMIKTDEANWAFFPLTLARNEFVILRERHP